MIAFPNIEESINELRGVIINSIIRITEMPKHRHTCCVDLENSLIIIVAEDIEDMYNIVLEKVIVDFILLYYYINVKDS